MLCECDYLYMSEFNADDANICQWSRILVFMFCWTVREIQNALFNHTILRFASLKRGNSMPVHSVDLVCDAQRFNGVIHPGGLYWKYNPGTLSLSQVCCSFEDLAPLDFIIDYIYGCPIFKRVAETEDQILYSLSGKMSFCQISKLRHCMLK